MKLFSLPNLWLQRQVSAVVVTAWLVIATGLTLLAQCPDAQQVYAQLNQVASGDDANQVIRQLLTLQQTVIRCRIANDSVQSKLLHVLGRTCWNSGNLELGLLYSRQAIAINTRRSPTAKRANLTHSYYNAGEIMLEQASYRQALTMFDSCIAIARQYPEKYASGAKAYASNAYLYFLLGDYERMLRSADLGYELAHLIGATSLMGQHEVLRAEALVQTQKYAPARVALEHALAIAKTNEATNEVALIYTRLADLNKRLNLRQEVIHYYELAYRVSKKGGYREGCAQALSNMGLYYRSVVHDNSKAIQIYQQALPYVDDPMVRFRVLDNIGYATWQQGHHADALNYYQQAFCAGLVQFRKLDVIVNPAPEQIHVTANKENVLSLIQDKADTWLDWGKTTGQHSYFQHALETYQLADQMIDFMRWEHTGTGSKLYWREKTRGLYERAIETCYRLGNIEQAYRFFEKSRAVMLTDKLNELGAHSQLTPEQAAQEAQLRQRISALQQELSAVKPESKAYQTARLKLSAEQEQLDGFIKQIEQSNPAYYRYKYDNTTQPLADVRVWLGKRPASLVSYFVGDSALYVLSVTAAGTKLQRQPVATYKPVVQEYIRLLADHDALNRQFSHYLSVSNALYRQVLAPLQLPAGRVIVSPDGFFVPFESLSRSATQPDYLMQLYAFSYTYSVKVLLKGQSANTAGDAFLGMAPVTYASGMEQASLLGSDATLGRIGETFSSPMLLTRQAATRRAFREQAANYRVIQLFTHADADSTNREPLLYFADSTLRLSDLTNGALPQTQLLVLSACKTGIGVNQRGEGVFSLARGFAALGVPSVLTTLWSVNSEPTYALTESFYRYLAEGLPKDVALQRAKQAYWQTAGRNEQLPDRWAGMILVGSAEPLQTPSPWPYVAGGGLLLAGGSWAVRRRRRTG